MTQNDLQKYLTDRSALPRTTTLFRESGLRTLLLYLKSAERIPEHQTRGAISVQCLAGQGRFFIADDGVDLRPGVLISVAASVAHSVVAAEQEDLLLLVTMSEASGAQ
jgi:quercetin dioxygenase-like cupin family protein